MASASLIARSTDAFASAASRATARGLAGHAIQALLDEADLTPKPALVDQRGSGAHIDLTLALMHRSANALLPCFAAIAHAAQGATTSQALRERLGTIGRVGERFMFAATGGINSHKGAIWSLGLLVAGSAMCGDTRDAAEIASAARAIALYPDEHAERTVTHGAHVQQMYGAAGARGEAQQGFPHVVHVGLPALRQARSHGVSENCARLDALMAIMAEIDDTCLLHRGGLSALHAAQKGARHVLNAGGSSTARGMALLFALDAELLRKNASPGGSADLLAATLFLDAIARDSAMHNAMGDAELWRN